jgi:hypothetical protein
MLLTLVLKEANLAKTNFSSNSRVIALNIKPTPSVDKVNSRKVA